MDYVRWLGEKGRFVVVLGIGSVFGGCAATQSNSQPVVEPEIVARFIEDWNGTYRNPI